MKPQKALLALTVVLLGVAAFAQDSASKFEVAVDYTYARFVPASKYVPNAYSLNGGGGSFDFNFSRYVGIEGEFEGYNSNTQRFTIPAGSVCPTGCSGNVQANLFTYLFGPQFGIRTGKIRPFAHVLVGGAHSNLAANLVALSGYAAARPANDAFALAFGGGVDIPVNHSGTIAIRPAEIDYLYTRFDINGNGGNSNFRYQAGVVFNF
jgi:hypothetical protein